MYTHTYVHTYVRTSIHTYKRIYINTHSLSHTHALAKNTRSSVIIAIRSNPIPSNTIHCNTIQYLDNKLRELDMGREQQGAAPWKARGVADELRDSVAQLRVAASQIHEQRRK